jgi:hypothetical protein
MVLDNNEFNIQNLPYNLDLTIPIFLLVFMGKNAIISKYHKNLIESRYVKWGKLSYTLYLYW